MRIYKKATNPYLLNCTQKWQKIKKKIDKSANIKKIEKKKEQTH